jgi:hypothetical protein
VLPPTVGQSQGGHSYREPSPVQQDAAMTGGEQDCVAWKPTQAPRQQRVQYSPRNALLLSAPFSTLIQIFSPSFSNSAFLRSTF